jgi:transposase-like protein
MLFLFHGDVMNTPVDARMNLVELTEKFGSDDRCREVLEQLRWPDGPKCPRCKEDATKIANRFQYDCDSCHYQFSVTAGTIFHDSHFSLWKWFIAIYLMTESRKGISANQIKRTLGLKGYKTAWYLCQRIRKAMAEVPLEPLKGIVEFDETYIGGRRRHCGAHFTGNKTMVLGAVERGGHCHLRTETRPPTTAVMREFVEEQLGRVPAENTRVMTDEKPAYRGAIRPGTMHQSVTHSKEEYVRGDVHTNSVENAWSLFKRSIVGSYHQVSKRHLDAYLDEFEWRFNNRKNPFLFRDTLLKLIHSDKLEYKKLVQQVA